MRSQDGSHVGSQKVSDRDPDSSPDPEEFLRNSQTDPEIHGSSSERASRPRAGASRAAALAAAHSPTAHRLVGAYAATCVRRPPHQVLTDLAVQVDSLLEESWPETDIGRALDAWGAKGLHPRSLPSVAHEVVNSTPQRAAQHRPSTTDQRVEAVEALRHTGTDTPSRGLRAIPGGQQ